MAEPPDALEVTQQDVNEFAKKLERWSNELPPKEQAVLAAMLAESPGLLSEEAQTAPPVVTFKVPLESIVGRFVVEREPSAIFIKESGPSWVNSPHHLGDWGEVVLPE